MILIHLPLQWPPTCYSRLYSRRLLPLFHEASRAQAFLRSLSTQPISLPPFSGRCLFGGGGNLDPQHLKAVSQLCLRLWSCLCGQNETLGGQQPGSSPTGKRGNPLPLTLTSQAGARSSPKQRMTSGSSRPAHHLTPGWPSTALLPTPELVIPRDLPHPLAPRLAQWCPPFTLLPQAGVEASARTPSSPLLPKSKSPSPVTFCYPSISLGSSSLCLHVPPHRWIRPVGLPPGSS